MIFIGVCDRFEVRPWNKDEPDFYVASLDQDELVVEAKFSNPFVYQVGTSMGCACELFTYDEEPDGFESERQQFYDLVNAQLAAGKKVEIYTCWAGDYEAPADEVTKMGETKIGAEFYYEDRELKVYEFS